MQAFAVLYVAWRDPDTHRIMPVARILRDDQGWYEFAYVRAVNHAKQCGFLEFVSFPEVEKVYKSRGMFPLLKNRLMQPSRQDYKEYLNQLGFELQPLDTFAILERSCGLRTTDTTELFGPPTKNTYGDQICVVWARGLPTATENVSSGQE